ncbi:MAG: hypothetical protein JSV25_13440 [Spirochaetota bacterium]|nr:MAG: hypothetical protein JSV25_13440 [Spirochaetota bacterium]
MANALNQKERLKLALNREEPDRVPIGEMIIDQKVIDGFGKGYKDVVDFAFGEGLDMVGTVAKFDVVKEFPDGSYIDEWGCTYQSSQDFTDHPIRGAINSIADLERIELPDPDAPHRLGGLEYLIKKSNGKLAINFHSRVTFMWSAFLMGIENLLMYMLLKPEFVHQVLKKVADINIRIIRRAVRAGADTITIGDDYCGNRGPFMSPEMFREFIFPHLKRAVSAIHEEGGVCIKHTDGNIWPILDQLVEAGIDGINPIDPLGGMDIGDVKQKYGNQICIMGNIDCTYLLCEGTEREMKIAVKDCIKKGAKGGGLIISSSNSIHSGVNPKNYSSMIEAVHRYGKYPITI